MKNIIVLVICILIIVGCVILGNQNGEFNQDWFNSFEDADNLFDLINIGKHLVAKISYLPKFITWVALTISAYLVSLRQKKAKNSRHDESENSQS